MEDEQPPDTHNPISDDEHSSFISPQPTSPPHMRTVTFSPLSSPPIDDHRLSTSEEPLLERRKQSLNKLFWFKIWSGRITSPPPTVDTDKNLPSDGNSSLNLGNICWLVLFGWWLSLIYAIVSVLLFLTFFGKPYAHLCWELRGYFLWPFGKYLTRVGERSGESQQLMTYKKASVQTASEELYGKSGPLALVAWCIFGVPILFVAHTLCVILCWYLIVFIPMAKINWRSMMLFFKSPLTVKVVDIYPGAGADVYLCTHQAANIYYYKHSIDGMNVILVNLLPFVVFSLVVGWIPGVSDFLHISPVMICVFSLISIIPLSYYLGMAISSLAAQTSMALGALLNATFGSIIELILLISAVSEGSLNELVSSSVTGTLVGMLLLLPGLSMIAAGIKHPEKDQFNRVSASVSSVLLIVSIVGAFTPTLFYRLYGMNSFQCGSCLQTPYGNGTMSCSRCSTIPITDYDYDPIYRNKARNLMYACAAVLPLGYVVGLLFTLKTHAHEVKKAEEESGGFMDESSEAPLWAKWKCVVILLSATAMFGLIAEQFVKNIQPTLDSVGISQQFAGSTFLAVITSIVDYANAIQFALQGNVALSIEIGISAAVQLALIQIPALVAFSAIVNQAHSKDAFTLIFPLFDVIAVIFAVIVVNYISIECKSNYFIGSVQILIYILLLFAFYFI